MCPCQLGCVSFVSLLPLKLTYFTYLPLNYFNRPPFSVPSVLSTGFYQLVFIKLLTAYVCFFQSICSDTCGTCVIMHITALVEGCLTFFFTPFRHSSISILRSSLALGESNIACQCSSNFSVLKLFFQHILPRVFGQSDNNTPRFLLASLLGFIWLYGCTSYVSYISRTILYVICSSCFIWPCGIFLFLILDGTKPDAGVSSSTQEDRYQASGNLRAGAYRWFWCAWIS